MEAKKETKEDEGDRKPEAATATAEPTSSSSKSSAFAKSGFDEEKISAALSASQDLDRKWQEMQDKMKQLTVLMAKNMQAMLGGAVPISEEDKKQVLDELTLEGVVKYIKDGKCKNIITMAGAGISTAAGIPDFRSPGTGLYNKLEEYNLPSPQSLFDINYFKKNPEPFFKIRVREFYMKVGEYKPTLSHYFIRLLAEEGLLLRHYTQNIDTLDKKAGIPEDKTVLAHGSFETWHCLGEDCKTSYSLDWIKKEVKADKIPKCTKCGIVIKPGIVMFGEALPERFRELSNEDFEQCDLLIIIGTSLAVQPFASLVNRVPVSTPRLLINRDKPSATQSDAMGALFGVSPTTHFQFDMEDNYRDVAYFGLCDDGCGRLAELLGWKKKLEQFMKSDSSSSSRKQTHPHCGAKHKGTK